MGQCCGKPKIEEVKEPGPRIKVSKEAKALAAKITTSVSKNKGFKILGSVPPIEFVKIGILLLAKMPGITYSSRISALDEALGLISRTKESENGEESLSTGI